MGKLIDMAGWKIGRLSVIKHVGYVPHHSALWLCKCECGAERVVRADSLRRKGNTLSCGCFNRELTGNRRRAHMSRHTPEYRSWQHMIQRTVNRNGRASDRYIGRGITVCERWAHSFENFLSDMGKKPTPKHSIDRINNDGNYEPSNCRWATARQQTQNYSRNVFIEHGGRRECLTEWARITGWSQTCIRKRMRLGIPISEILTPKSH